MILFFHFLIYYYLNYARRARLSSLVWALKPVLIAETDRVEPQDSHWTKYKRLSLLKIVSGDLQVLHVTYSTIYIPNIKEISKNILGIYKYISLSFSLFQTRFLYVKQRRKVLTNISSQYIFDLLLLPSTLHNKTLGAINWTISTQFSKQELNNVFRLTMESRKELWISI